jgi:hypothetical protein
MGDAIPREHLSDAVMERAAEAFGVLARNVELAAAAGMIIAPDATEVAQQLWNAVHGAVALELKGMTLTPDPARTYEALLVTVVRGLTTPGAVEAGAEQDAEAGPRHGQRTRTG